MNQLLHPLPAATPYRHAGHALMHLLAGCLMIMMLTLAGCGGDSDSLVTTTPVIDVQPTSQSAVSGTSLTLSVTAHGDGLAYQWQSSTDSGTTWADVAGATSASYTLTALASSMNGWQYRVTITSGNASVQSSAVTITVTAATAPGISVQPAASQVAAGASVSFSVTATGTALAYQWQISTDGSTWANISGATAVTYNLGTVAVSDSGHQFRVLVSNSVGGVTSSAALLTVTAASAAPLIRTQPTSASVVVGQTATFTMAAIGSPAPTYQWQSSSDGGATFADISGANVASYTTPATATTDSGKQFRAIVSNSAGSVTSTAATLTVTAASTAPAITNQPADQSVTAPATATFSVVASGSPTPTYQWQVSTDGGTTFTNINGATAASYTTSATTSADNGKRFQVIVTNSGGSTTSRAATLTVNTGGNSAGNGASASCSPYSLPVGKTVNTVWVNSTNAALNSTGTIVNNGSVTFAGHSVTEYVVDTTLQAWTLHVEAYFSFDASTGVTIEYGSVSRTGGSGIEQDVTSVFTPPVTDLTYSLSAGQSVASQTTTSTQTTTLTTNGVAGAPTTATVTDSTDAMTFVGFETVTVPAGTFNTCRYLDTTTNTTTWWLPGYATTVKDSTGGAAASITVNGVALTHN